MEICDVNIVQEQVCQEGMPQSAAQMGNSILEECPLGQPDVDKHEMTAHKTDSSNEIVTTSVPMPFTTGSDKVIWDNKRSTVQDVEYKCNVDEAACAAESCYFHNSSGINFPAMAQARTQRPDDSICKIDIVAASASEDFSMDDREYLQLEENQAKEEDHLYLEGSAMAQARTQRPAASTCKIDIVAASASKDFSMTDREYLQLEENQAKEEDHLYLEGSGCLRVVPTSSAFIRRK